MIEKPYRLRSERYLRFIRGQACIVCGNIAEAHHIQFAQPRAMARKTGDQFTVPLCHGCHMELHNFAGPERTFWALKGIDPVVWATRTFHNWSKEHGAEPQR